MVEVTLSKDGRLSITVNDGSINGGGKTVVGVDLPAHKGESKDAFTPGIKMNPEIERGMLESLLTKYFGDDMAKSLLITNGIKGSLLEE